MWNYIHDHLLSTEEGVADEFASAQSHWLLSICHDGGLLLANRKLGPEPGSIFTDKR